MDNEDIWREWAMRLLEEGGEEAPSKGRGSWRTSRAAAMLTMMTFVGGGRGRMGTTTTTTTTGRRKAWGKAALARGDRARDTFFYARAEAAAVAAAAAALDVKDRVVDVNVKGKGKALFFSLQGIAHELPAMLAVASEKGKRGLAYVINWTETFYSFGWVGARANTASAARESRSDEMCYIDGNGAHP
ncbi:hypothetical protein BJV74DRAFT_114609 [Russula compacta]|nr:hypothetical protein BJV74DRAFT_114609 [Russula compacta]